MLSGRGQQAIAPLVCREPPLRHRCHKRDLIEVYQPHRIQFPMCMESQVRNALGDAASSATPRHFSACLMCGYGSKLDQELDPRC